MTLHTTIEYLDGHIEGYQSKHLFRADSVGAVYRILLEDGMEITIPYCVVRKTRCNIVKEGENKG